jgi:hypothetical protein
MPGLAMDGGQSGILLVGVGTGIPHGSSNKKTAFWDLDN